MLMAGRQECLFLSLSLSLHRRLLSQLLHPHSLSFAFIPLLAFLLHFHHLILQMLSLPDELFLGGL
jgi:hypothetical protein